MPCNEKAERHLGNAEWRSASPSLTANQAGDGKRRRQRAAGYATGGSLSRMDDGVSRQIVSVLRSSMTLLPGS